MKLNLVTFFLFSSFSSTALPMVSAAKNSSAEDSDEAAVAARILITCPQGDDFKLDDHDVCQDELQSAINDELQDQADRRMLGQSNNKHRKLLCWPQCPQWCMGNNRKINPALCAQVCYSCPWFRTRGLQPEEEEEEVQYTIIEENQEAPDEKVHELCLNMENELEQTVENIMESLENESCKSFVKGCIHLPGAVELACAVYTEPERRN